MTNPIPQPPRKSAVAAVRLVDHVSRYWMAWFSLLYGLFVALPFAAPALMAAGWDGAGRAIYTLYSFLCHQLPQRSYFLFGAQISYPISAFLPSATAPADFMSLRQFIGAPGMGWKVAWSDRMVSMYTGILLFAWLWYPLRRRVRPLSLLGLGLLALPMALDGFSHMASDLAGLGQGFRDSNAWLAALTGSAFPAGFYAGDAWGSFNAWMRLLTGLLFALGIVWFCFPHAGAYFEAMRNRKGRRGEWRMNGKIQN
jgi:uncharacterized membrane protein